MDSNFLSAGVYTLYRRRHTEFRSKLKLDGYFFEKKTMCAFVSKTQEKPHPSLSVKSTCECITYPFEVFQRLVGALRIRTELSSSVAAENSSLLCIENTPVHKRTPVSLPSQEDYPSREPTTPICTNANTPKAGCLWVSHKVVILDTRSLWRKNTVRGCLQ